MKITSISYWKEDMELSRPYTITYTTHYTVDNIFIKIDCENSVYGIGAGSSSEHVTGEIMDTDYLNKENVISNILVGKSLSQLPLLIKQISTQFINQPALRAAIDMALHDAYCKWNNIHISKYLGSVVKPILTSITIGIKNIEETIEEGNEYVARGFKIIKLKIGTNYDVDLERYIKLKEALGSKILVRVDANQGFNPKQLIDFIDKTQKFPVEFFEQPFPQGEYAKLKTMDSTIREVCAGDEDIITLSNAINLCSEPKPYGIYNIKLMKCGGITEGMKIAEAAMTKNISLMWGCMDESCISISAALNTALACPNTKYLDLDGSFDLAKDIAKGGFFLKEGKLIPDVSKLGLGVELID